MMSREQCEQVATCACAHGATVSLEFSGLRIEMRHGFACTSRTVSYLEVYQHRFPAEMLCDTIRYMADKMAQPSRTEA